MINPFHNWPKHYQKAYAVGKYKDIHPTNVARLQAQYQKTPATEVDSKPTDPNRLSPNNVAWHDNIMMQDLTDIPSCVFSSTAPIPHKIPLRNLINRVFQSTGNRPLTAIEINVALFRMFRVMKDIKSMHRTINKMVKDDFLLARYDVCDGISNNRTMYQVKHFVKPGN